MKKVKLFKILLSAASITTLSASGFGLVSCHSNKKTTSLWTEFKDAATHDSALNIIKSTHSKQWVNPQAKNLTLGDFFIDEYAETISVKITNLLPYSTVKFTIQYPQNDQYNVADWVCNNDYNFNFSYIANFPDQVDSLTQNTKITNTINKIVTIDNTLYVGTQGGLFQSSDGKSFTQNKTVFTPFQPSLSVKLIKKINNVIYLGTLYGLYQSNDDGKTFIFNNSVSKDTINKITMINKNIYIGTNSSGVYSSSNNGKGFARIDSAGDAVANQPNIYYTNTVIEEINHNIYIGNQKGNIFLSTNDGKTFKKQYSFNAKVAISQIKMIKGILYIGTAFNSQNFDNHSCLYSSNDMCKTCNRVLHLPGYYEVVDIINCNNDIIVAIKNSFTSGVFGDIENGIYISHDGKNFTKIEAFNQSQAHNFILGIWDINSVLYVSTSESYYSSIDNKRFVDYNYSAMSHIGYFNNSTYVSDKTHLYVDQKLNN